MISQKQDFRTWIGFVWLSDHHVLKMNFAACIYLIVPLIWLSPYHEDCIYIEYNTYDHTSMLRVGF
jgi:hypothetical protein